MNGEGQRERETQNRKQAPGSEPSAQSLTRGSNSRTAISWTGWSRTLNRLRHPVAPIVLLFNGVSDWLWNQGSAGFIERVCKFSFHFYVLEQFQENRCQLFLKCLVEFPPGKPSGPGLLVFGRFLITNSMSLLVMGLFKFSISSCFSFGSVYVSRNLSISSRLPISLAYNCSYYSLVIVLISAVLVVISPLSFYLYLSGSFPFSFWSNWLVVYQFC